MSTEHICYHAEMTLHLNNIKTAGFHMTSAKIQTTKLLILLRFYFNDVSEQPKTNIHTNFCSEWVLGLVIDYA